MKGTAQRSVVTILLATLTSSCAIFELGEELEKLEDISHLYTGSVTSEVMQFHSTIVVALEDRQAEKITSFRMLAGSGVFEIRSEKTPKYFFAFADLNKDLRFQADEPFGWAAGGQPVTPHDRTTSGIDIAIATNNEVEFPSKLVGEPLENHLNNYARTHIGTISSLNNPLFSVRQGKKGLWAPFAFMEDGGTGLHFLQPYDPAKVPVLFVHGINGAPQDFASLIEQIDTTQFQVWVLSYPSGLRLSWLARGMFQFVEVLHRQYDFDELHVVAHSMGGLISRGSLNLCVENDACEYLRSYTTISTPWSGVAAAQSGVKYAPEVVPVWHDLDPDSEYLTTLFDTPMPIDVPHHLLFGFRQDGVSSQSSDGVIKLSSQLRSAAQVQATSVRGFDEGHVSILHSDDVIENVNSILTKQNR